MKENLKAIEELKEGSCQVVTNYIHGEKIFNAYYKEKYSCVFFTIPSNYEIIGYIQD